MLRRGCALLLIVRALGGASGAMVFGVLYCDVCVICVCIVCTVFLCLCPAHCVVMCDMCV